MHACTRPRRRPASQVRFSANSKAKKKGDRSNLYHTACMYILYIIFSTDLESISWDIHVATLQFLGLTRWNYIVQRAILKQRNLRQFWNHPCRALSLPPLYWSISTNVQLQLEIDSNAISWSSMQWILPSSSLLPFFSFSSSIAALHMYIVVWLSFSRRWCWCWSHFFVH